jgi:chloramphenicol-sensitive protein RarD
VTETRRGFWLGVAAYSLWGLFPLYWPLLEPAGSLELLAHRVFWSMVVMVVATLALRRTARLAALFRERRTVRLLTLAAVVISVNWLAYIWGVTHDHVVETSLGYFINPLVTVLMGVVLLGERLRPWQWTAMGIATVAVVGLTAEYGRPPWVALALAFSFGTYGLVKKTADASAVDSLTVETLVLAPLAAAYLGWLAVGGDQELTGHGAGHVLLLMSAGVVTAVPLVCFGGAATRVSMTTLGLLQYLAPTLQFAVGVAVFGEPMPAMRWAGFALVWLALVVFTVESLAHHRRNLARAAEAAAL